MELTPRLRSVANLVPEGTRFADIGTDHAYLPVRLLLDHRIKSAIAADLREGPLNNARETAEQYGVSGQISFRLCNGLADISANEVDTVAIAGMGGETIASILEAAPWTKDGKLLLLQPMTSFPDLRLWLQKNGYTILNEVISREGKRLYTCLVVTGGKMGEMTLAELWVGKHNHDPLRPEFLVFMKDKLTKALKGHMSAAEPDEAEICHLTEAIDDIRAMEGEF